MMSRSPILIVGGGAAGFFAAIACAERSPGRPVRILEASAHWLTKVRISGGGRCNVTQACFEPRELARRYPRGSRELLGPFHRFGPCETVAWFETRGVALKTEADGRMFPTTDDSATIVECLVDAARKAGVELLTRHLVRSIERYIFPNTDARFRLELADGRALEAFRVLVATGGTRGSGGGHAWAAHLGHTIEPPVPSLFTFHIDDPRLKGLEGLSAPGVTVSLPGAGLEATGPLLITHWGMSGPAILKLSAWGARELEARDYRTELRVNWIAPRPVAEVKAELARQRAAHPKRQVATANPFGLPGRLWERLVEGAGLSLTTAWAGVSNARLDAFAEELVAGSFLISGKSLNKEEFVTCGGVRLSEIDFRTMESRICPGVYFAGEVIDVDGVTGGYNFQAAWTTGHLAGVAMANE